VCACGSNGDCPLGHLLAADISKVDFIPAKCLKQFGHARRGGFDLHQPCQKTDGLAQTTDRDHFDLLDHGGLGGAGLGHEQAPQSLSLGGGNRHRERALGGPRGAIEGQLAHHGVLG